MEARHRHYWGHIAIAVILVLLAHGQPGARTHAKVAKSTPGTPPPSVRTLAMPDAYAQSRSMENAYWNGVFIAYGDGGEMFGPLASALDVAAHEMTHGIIERTVNLEYRFQSGALNESFADIFAAMVDDDDWSMGEDIANKARR